MSTCLVEVRIHAERKPPGGPKPNYVIRGVRGHPHDAGGRPGIGAKAVHPGEVTACHGGISAWEAVAVQPRSTQTQAIAEPRTSNSSLTFLSTKPSIDHTNNTETFLLPILLYEIHSSLSSYCTFSNPVTLTARCSNLQPWLLLWLRRINMRSWRKLVNLEQLENNRRVSLT